MRFTVLTEITAGLESFKKQNWFQYTVLWQKEAARRFFDTCPHMHIFLFTEVHPLVLLQAE